MGYKTLLVHLEVGQPNTSLLKAAYDVARHFGANVIGAGACQPTQLILNDGYVSGDVIAQERADIELALKDAEAEFRAAFSGLPAKEGRVLEWRSAVTLEPLHFFLLEAARRVDLVITGVATRGFFEGWTHHASNGELAVQAGRPVLIVPHDATGFSLQNVVIAWKDVREARRAVADALPMLRWATQITIVEIATDVQEAAKRLDDVVRYLAAHGIAATGLPVLADGNDADALHRIAQDRHADLIVAGAYGHSRLREWAFGGVTQHMLAQPARCTLLSH